MLAVTCAESTVKHVRAISRMNSNQFGNAHTHRKEAREQAKKSAVVATGEGEFNDNQKGR
jgi:hypothetical protein